MPEVDPGENCGSGGVPAQGEETEFKAGESALAKDVAQRRRRLARTREF